MLTLTADGIPKPVIKWKRESQTFELPIYDEQHNNEKDNELDDVGARQPTGGAKIAGDNFKRSIENDLDAQTQVAVRSIVSRNRVVRNTPDGRDDLYELVETADKQNVASLSRILAADGNALKGLEASRQPISSTGKSPFLLLIPAVLFVLCSLFVVLSQLTLIEGLLLKTHSDLPVLRVSNQSRFKKPHKRKLRRAYGTNRN